MYLDRRTVRILVSLLAISLAGLVALQAVATALFANSPFLDGKPNGHKSWRSRVWRDLDAARTGMLPFVFEDCFPDTTPPKRTPPA